LIKVWREGYRHGLKPTSQASYDDLMKVVISPTMGRRLVKDLSHQDVKDLHRKTEKGGHETNANRAVAVLSRLLSIAEKRAGAHRAPTHAGSLRSPPGSPAAVFWRADEYAALETADWGRSGGWLGRSEAGGEVANEKKGQAGTS